MIIDSADDLARRISDFGDASPKYDQLFEGYARLALQPGSAVLIFAPNSVEFLFHWIAALVNGYISALLATLFKESTGRTERFRPVHCLTVWRARTLRGCRLAAQPRS